MTQQLIVGEAYADMLARRNLLTHLTGIWAHYRMPTRPHGWKLHLSSVQSEAPALLERVAPVLQTHEVPFKVAVGPSILGLLNEGLLGDTQVGKFITIYADTLPPDRQTELTDHLITLTASFQGPRITTDAYLGGVVYCRYGDFRPEKRRNRLGIFESAPGDQQLVRYRIPFEVPPGVEGAERFGIIQPEKASLELLGPGYLPVGTIADHAKGTVYLALDLRSQANVKKVVLKHGRAGCMSDELGRDVRDRLQHHAAAEAAVRGRVHTPAVEDCFVHEGDAYLALELLDGFDLGSFAGVPFRRRDDRSRADLLRAIHSTAKELAALHDCGFVHRDLSPSNVLITSDDLAYLLDLELAHELGKSAAPYPQGTVGFVSPQQVQNLQPVVSDDVFSLGAVIASLLTGVPGQFLPVGRPALGTRLARLSGANEELCEVVATCLDVQPGGRPSMADVLHAVASARTVDHVPRPAPEVDPLELTAAVEGGIQWLIQGAMRDERTGMWVSPTLEAAHNHHRSPIVDWRVYRSANRGVAGVLYLLAKLWRHEITRDVHIPTAVNLAADWLLAHNDSPDDQMPGLHFGEAGVAVAICEAIAAGLIGVDEWTRPYLTEVFSARPDWPDLTHGAAGQGLSALYCGWLTNERWVSEAADAYADYLIEAQAADGSWVMPPGVEAMADKAFTGFAHGVAGIVHFLAYHAAMRDNDRSLEAAERGGEWLLDHARPNSSGSGLAWPIDPTTEESWNWWCHGAPGIARAFISLYRTTGSELYAGTARACLRTVPEGFRAGNLSQCHGLAGLGELLLEGGEVLCDTDLLERGLQIASMLADLAAPVEGGLAWRVEGPYATEVDLMTGGAGVTHFLARAAHMQASFGMPLDLPAPAVPASPQ